MSETKLFDSRAEKLLIPTLGILLGFVGGYAVRFATEPTETQSEESVVESLRKMNVLENSSPCRNEPLELGHNNVRYVVADTRCDTDEYPDLDIFGVTSSSILGPIARIKKGTILEADCIAEGEPLKKKYKDEKYRSNEWVKVSIVDPKGVVFLTDKSEGYINSLEVIGESNLPQCEEILPDVTRTI